MAWSAIDQYGLLTDDAGGLSPSKTGGAMAIGRLHPDSVPDLIWSPCSLPIRQTRVNALDAHSVPIDCIGGCTCSSHSILWRCIISIDRFRDRACLPRHDPLHASVAPLCNAVATRHICTSVSEPDPPLVYETPKLHAAKGCVVVREDLFRRSPFVKYGLQFTDDTGGVLFY